MATAPGGRAAVIVPEGLLFGSSTGHVELRRKLCEDFELLAVVSRDASRRPPQEIHYEAREPGTAERF